VTALIDLMTATAGDDDEAGRTVPSAATVRFSWDYAGATSTVRALADRGLSEQWAIADLPWATEVDAEALARTTTMTFGRAVSGMDVSGTTLNRWGEREWLELAIQAQNWLLSQMLHGEQAALLGAARLVESATSMDFKRAAAVQTLDEARHVDVLLRYLDEKIGGHYPLNGQMGHLLDTVLGDSRWDVTALGVQVLVEGFALAATGLIRQLVDEPLLRALLARVQADEVRHVDAGMAELAQVNAQLSAAEIEERQRFVYEGVIHLRERLLMQEVWERTGLAVEDATRLVAQLPERTLFQRVLFAKIVPACAQVGLLERANPWLRDRFAELNILEFAVADQSPGDVENED
jgi:hypothetical protein